MKKVLTLVSALSMVAGSAFAHDYNWSVGKTPAVDKNHVVANTNGKLTYQNSEFKFQAEENDVVTVKVANNDQSSDMTVVIAGVENLVKQGQAVELTQTVKAGDVTIKVTGSGYITQIAVESQAYRDASAAIKDAQAALNDANSKTAVYATLDGGKFADFFTAVRAELNKQGANIEKEIVNLKSYKSEDTVAANLDALKKALGDIKTALTTKVADAESAKKSYDAIVNSQNAKDAQTAIDNAKKTELPANALTVSADKKTVTNNGTSSYIYNYKPEVKSNKVQKLVKESNKRDWVDSEMAKVQTELDNTKADVLKSLAKFPNHFQGEETSDKFADRFNTNKGYVANLVARANVEVAHAEHVTTLANDAKTLDKALNSGFDKSELAGYDAWKENVNKLAEAIAKPDNRYEVSPADLKTSISDKCDAAVSSQETYRKNIIKQSYNKLTAKLGEVQNELNDKSYKVSAKYQNEPETQKKYELEFAKIQNNLNTYKTGYKSGSEEGFNLANAWSHQVENYDKRVEELGEEETSIKNLWEATEEAQKTQVKNDNKKKADKLFASIQAVRAYYDAQVLKINGYKTFEPTKSIADKIDTSLKNLFDIVLKLEQTKSDIEADLTEKTKIIENASSVEFDATSNIYRLDDTKWTSNDEIGGIKAEIVAEVAEAIKAANIATYAYLYDEDNDGKEKFSTVTGMKACIKAAKDAVTTGTENKLMSPAAATKFNTAYDEIADKYEIINKVSTQVGKIEVAKAEIEKFVNDAANNDFKLDTEVPAAGKTANNLVDQITAINAKTLDLVPAAISAVNTELESYKNQYNEIGKLKVDWSVAKADIANLYKKAHEADASLTATAFEKDLNAINDNVAKISEELEKNATSATSVAETTAVDLAKQKEELKKINNYPLYVANTKAYDEANKLYNEVSTALANAKKTVSALKDNVKDEYLPQLNAFDAKLSAENTAMNTKDKDWEKYATNLANVKASLENYQAQIANILKAAQEASQVDESLDYNKDGEINDADQRAAQTDAQEGVLNLDTYFDWVNKFIKYSSNNK